MSGYERNKGKLIPTGVDTEHFTDDEYETYEENGFAIIDGEVYEIQWEIKRFMDDVEFAEAKLNADGSIDFHTLHYNGGAHWTEVVEDALNDD